MKPVTTGTLAMIAWGAVACAVAGAAQSQQPSTGSSVSVARASFKQDGSVQLPTGYRQWQHVGTRVKTGGNSVLDGTRIVTPQVMNAYVEPGAFEAFRKTGAWPEGTQIVKDFSLIMTGKECDPASFICSTPYGLGLFESRFIGLGMMVKDSRRFGAETGHWGYFSFIADPSGYPALSPARSREQCSSCHEKFAAATDYVFSNTHIGLLPENLQ
jgi:hypothetical protein